MRNIALVRAGTVGHWTGSVQLSLRFMVAALAVLTATLAVPPARAQEMLPLTIAHGVVDKAGKDALTVKPRGADGKFLKTIVLKIVGTSRVTTLTPQTRGGKVVLTQRDADVADLKPGQPIAVIYTTLKEGPVLLTGVVSPAGDK